MIKFRGLTESALRKSNLIADESHFLIYCSLLKTGAFDNAIREFSLA